MNTQTYQGRRSQIEHYFDRTAAETWRRLTSDEPVGRIRATVRAGRDEMRMTLLGWLPADLTGRRILDAGCGTGAFAIEAARRGADVVAVDLSPTLVDHAQKRADQELESAKSLGCSHTKAGRVTFFAGDMLDKSFGAFDHVVAMDSVIHYVPADSVKILTQLANRTRESILFTFAPRTPALTMMHAVGRFFPRSDRAPAIEPVDALVLRGHFTAEPALNDWQVQRTHRVASGFYISQALELARK